jgi:hypothetical protein
MTISGWIFLTIGWVIILGLFLFALLRTLRLPKNSRSVSSLPPDSSEDKNVEKTKAQRS